MADELRFLECTEIVAAILTLVVSHALTMLAILAFRWTGKHRRFRKAAAVLMIPAAFAVLFLSMLAGCEVFRWSYVRYLQRTSTTTGPIFFICFLPGRLRQWAPVAGMASALLAYGAICRFRSVLNAAFAYRSKGRVQMPGESDPAVWA